MHCIKSYKDLILEIEMTEDRIERLERERELYKKSMYEGAPKDVGCQQYSDLPKGNRAFVTLDRIIERINRIDNELLLEYDRIEILKKSEKKIKGKLQKLEGLEYKIMYHKEIDNMGIQEIADELNYSYQWIANVITRINKRERGE